MATTPQLAPWLIKSLNEDTIFVKLARKAECSEDEDDFDGILSPLPTKVDLQDVNECLDASLCPANSTCINTYVTPQSCTASQVGHSVNYKLSGLCMAQVTSSMGGFSAASSSTNTISYKNLLATPCYNADPANMYCYSVYSSALSYSPMLVSLGVSGISGSGGQGPYGRRLLGIDDGPEFFSHDDACMDAWDEFLATNKSTRVMAGCVTRFAATYDVVSQHGMLDYIPPNMFVSWSDFIATVGERPESLLILLYSPRMAVDLIFRTPTFNRLYRYYFIWVSALSDAYFDIAVHKRLDANGSLHYEVDADGGVFINGHNISEMTLILLNLLHGAHRHFNATETNHTLSLAVRNRESVRKLLSMTSLSPLATELLYNGSGVEERVTLRHLMQFTSWKTQMKEVQRFTGSTALNNGVQQSVGTATDAAWVNSPFAWPINYDFGGTVLQCQLPLRHDLELLNNASGTKAGPVGQIQLVLRGA
ncbi:hypothetical protein GUITHDRAFT_122059 [Guillardia theta CCMP2712]|uniref:Uncharacterized protein n=1 Tax=Guillardia theta (strain CCMP2712) TaxID=905079 RepID=L1I799_GUITC|nr:hypothetical protein GUITHDRAFT_122059 [Guillardia theta CCMP2712]EKX31744.1 hypothetical protein GUITHDRAFT_122059 [Guillardia theta CCMP2712]|eukprot:XP_005818724.1 hypothetical protein GUITHDRAFT_122059 [Guillardia theta CCMP2712]